MISHCYFFPNYWQVEHLFICSLFAQVIFSLRYLLMDFVHSSLWLGKNNKYLCHLYVFTGCGLFFFFLCCCVFVESKRFVKFILVYQIAIFSSTFLFYLRKISTAKCYEDVPYFLPKVAFNIQTSNPFELCFCIWCENGIQYYLIFPIWMTSCSSTT